MTITEIPRQAITRREYDDMPDEDIAALLAAEWGGCSGRSPVEDPTYSDNR